MLKYIYAIKQKKKLNRKITEKFYFMAAIHYKL